MTPIDIATGALIILWILSFIGSCFDGETFVAFLAGSLLSAPLVILIPMSFQ